MTLSIFGKHCVWCPSRRLLPPEAAATLLCTCDSQPDQMSSAKAIKSLSLESAESSTSQWCFTPSSAQSSRFFFMVVVARFRCAVLKITPNNFRYPHSPAPIKTQSSQPIITGASHQDPAGHTSSSKLPQPQDEINGKDMSGNKRDRNGRTKGHHDEPKRGAPLKPVSRNEYTSMFEHFRDELDEHHDRRERIVKASRDITALSKKM